MMHHGLALVLSVVVLEATARCGKSHAASRSRRMVNGDKTLPKQYPWMVSIQSEQSHECGGVLINSRFVLSAAHCFPDPVRVVTVLLGVHRWTGNEASRVEINGTVYRHPHHDRQSQRIAPDENDIALIKLHSAVCFSETIRPICLPRAGDRVAVDDDVLAIGWGDAVPTWQFPVTEQDYELTASLRHPQLLQLPLQVVDTIQCVQDIVTYERNLLAACERGDVSRGICETLKLTSSPGPLSYGDHNPLMICASAPKGTTKRSLCFGDSGGPLMKQRKDGAWVVVWIISDGVVGCITFPESSPQTGELCTDVLHLMNWIESSMESFDALVNNSFPVNSSSLVNSSCLVNSSSHPFVGHLTLLCLAIVVIRLIEFEWMRR